MIKVAHIIKPYLAMSCNWIYPQLLDKTDTKSIVLTTNIQNVSHFPTKTIYCISNLNIVEKLLNEFVRIVFLKYYPSWYNIIRKEKVSIIHSHFGNRGFKNIQLSKKSNVKHVVSFYGYDMSMLPQQNPKWEKNYLKLFKQVSLILVEGNSAKNRLMNLGCPENKLRVFKLGVDVNKIDFKERIRREGEPLKILIAGRFTEKKGIPYAIEALGKLYRKRKNIHITLVGDSGELPEEINEKKIIFNLIEKYDLSRVIDYKGFIPIEKLHELSYDSHIFLSPSVVAKTGDIEGGSPVIITEMLASGMPVISTKHCDIPEVVIHGKSGFLAEEKNVDELTTYLDIMYQTNDYRSYSKSAREYIESNFNVEHQQNKLEQIYHSLI